MTDPGTPVEAAGTDIGPAPGPAADGHRAPKNPFVGPRALRTGEPLFGRDHEVSELFGLLVSERIVLLHAPSGAGKTSLIQAGLVPRLREEDIPVWPTIRVNTEPAATDAA